MVEAPSLTDNNEREKYSLQIKLLGKKFLKFNNAVYCSVVTNCCTAASFRVILKRRKPIRPGFKAGPHAHVDNTWTPPINAYTRTRLPRTRRRTINGILLTSQLC